MIKAKTEILMTKLRCNQNQRCNWRRRFQRQKRRCKADLQDENRSTMDVEVLFPVLFITWYNSPRFILYFWLLSIRLGRCRGFSGKESIFYYFYKSYCSGNHGTEETCCTALNNILCLEVLVELSPTTLVE